MLDYFANMFVPDKPFQTSLMFASKAVAYLKTFDKAWKSCLGQTFSGMFVPEKPFQTSLMFASKDGTYLRSFDKAGKYCLGQTI